MGGRATFPVPSHRLPTPGSASRAAMLRIPEEVRGPASAWLSPHRDLSGCGEDPVLETRECQLLTSVLRVTPSLGHQPPAPPPGFVRSRRPVQLTTVFTCLQPRSPCHSSCPPPQRRPCDAQNRGPPEMPISCSRMHCRGGSPMPISSLCGRKTTLHVPRGPDVITGSWKAERDLQEKTRHGAVWEGHEPPSRL